MMCLPARIVNGHQGLSFCVRGARKVAQLRALTTSSKVLSKDDYLKDMQSQSSVTRSDKWIIKTFGPSGKYANSKEIPDHVNTSELDRAKSTLRIYLNTAAMIAVVLAAVYFIRLGKSKQVQGETLEKMNLAKKQALKDEKV